MSTQNADERIEIDVCCDAFIQAVEADALQVVDVKGGEYRVVVTNGKGEHGFAVNFCPFCGGPRPDSEVAITQE